MDYVLLFLPALIANGAPPVFAKIFPKLLNKPVDFGLKLRGKRLLGDHKTIRGFVSGIIMGALTYLLIRKYITLELPLYFGALVGLTVLTFDSLKSFLKRQFAIKPGKAWFPFDEIDWIIGFLIILNVFTKTSLLVDLLYLLSGIIIHLIFKLLGYLLKINETYI